MSTTTKETISTEEMHLFSIDRRLGRIASALENGNRGADILTLEISRLADAFGIIADVLSCLTETVEGADRKERCVLRTFSTPPNFLAMSDEG